MDEHLRIADRLREVEDLKTLFAGLVAHAPVAFQVCGRDGRALFANQAFRDLFGSDPPPDYTIFEDSVLKERGVLSVVHRAFAGETTRMPPQWYDARDLRNVRVETGRRVAVEVTLFPLRDNKGEVQHVALCFKD